MTTLYRPNDQQFAVSRPFRVLRGNRWVLNTQFWKVVSCKEIDCEDMRKGYMRVVAKGSSGYDWVKANVGKGKLWDRYYIERDLGDSAGNVACIFPPGQPCMRIHYLPVERVPSMAHRPNKTTNYRQVDEDEWFYEWQDQHEKLVRLANRG